MWRTVFAMLVVAGVASAGEVPCPDPLPPAHDNTTEYKTKRAPAIFDFLIRIPLSHASQLPGDINECRIEIGNPLSPVQVIIIANPDPETCWREDASTLEWREPVTMWCTSLDDGVGPIENTTARFKIRGKAPELRD